MSQRDCINTPVYSRRQMLKLTGTVTVLGILGPATLASLSRAAESEGKKTLIVYFSMPETDNPNNMTRDEDNSVVVINGKVLGNTQYIAQLIQQMTGGDMFRIEPHKPYSTDHRKLVALAKEEQNRNNRPVFTGKIENMHSYDTIFIGYPNWWTDMPMILYTFLETYDLSDKTIIPFNTHGGSRFSNTISTIADLQPHARVLRNGFTISRDSMDQAESGVAKWITKLGYKK